MSWTEYLRRIAGSGAGQAEIARAAKVATPTVSRWLSGEQGVKPAAAANFARAHGRPVLEAFIAAGFLTAEEASARPSVAPDYTQLTNDELLGLVRARMREERDRHDSAAATKTAEPGLPDQPGRTRADIVADLMSSTSDPRPAEADRPEREVGP